MEISSSHQIYVFFLCFLSGIGCGVFFDFQRSVRKLSRVGLLRIAIEDIAFDVMCVFAAIWLGFYFNNGQMRYYQVLGAISGALFYAAFLSHAVMRVLGMTYRFAGKFILRPLFNLFKIMSLPFVKLSMLTKALCRKIVKLFLRISKRLKERKKQLKKRMKML